MKATVSRRKVPKAVRDLPLGGRIRWARKSAGLSHDRLVSLIGRSNRGHLIKIEAGHHVPRPDLRDAIADATCVPRELFEVDDEDESRAMTLDQILAARIRAILAEQTERP